jgi:hypothetical protein
MLVNGERTNDKSRDDIERVNGDVNILGHGIRVVILPIEPL